MNNDFINLRHQHEMYQSQSSLIVIDIVCGEYSILLKSDTRFALGFNGKATKKLANSVLVRNKR